MKEDVYEVCPHCYVEIKLSWDVPAQGYIAKCPNCGNRLLLCSECDHDTCDYDHRSDLCKRIVEAMWQELMDVPMEISNSGDEFLPEALTLHGITFPSKTTKTELWRWFDEHYPRGVTYLLANFY